MGPGRPICFIALAAQRGFGRHEGIAVRIKPQVSELAKKSVFLNQLPEDGVLNVDGRLSLRQELPAPQQN
jgi:hypothetical protein